LSNSVYHLFQQVQLSYSHFWLSIFYCI